MPEATLGLGWHSFDFANSKEGSITVWILSQRVGDPVGQGPVFWSSRVLFVQGNDQQPLLRICQEAEKAATEHKENHVSLWRFDSHHRYWTRLSRRLARSIDSIVLEEKAKKLSLGGPGMVSQRPDQSVLCQARHPLPSLLPLPRGSWYGEDFFHLCVSRTHVEEPVLHSDGQADDG